jgi:hypothetical protein
MAGNEPPTAHDRTGPGEPNMMYERFTYIHGYGIGPLHIIIAAALIVIPFWQIFSKAGFSGWLSLLMLVPLINVLALYFLAFADWPAGRDKLSVAK